MLALSQPLVDALLFTTGPAYPRYVGAHGISALTDQRLAGRRDDDRAAADARRSASPCCCGRTCASGSGSPPSRERAGLDVVQLRAALPRARRRGRLRLRAAGADGRAAVGLAGDAVRARRRVRRGLAQLAAGDDRDPLPARDPPAAERDGRRLGAAAARARPDAGDAGRRSCARGALARRADPAALRPAVLAGRLVRRPPAGVLRLRAAAPVAAERRARPLARGRPALLVAGLLRAASAPLVAR